MSLRDARNLKESLARCLIGALVTLGLIAVGVYRSQIRTSSPDYTHAVHYTVVDIGTLGGAKCFPSYINNRGDVVGEALTSNPDIWHAFIYRAGKMRDLGTLDAEQSNAHCVNDTGDIVGTSDTPRRRERHAVLWHDGKATDLGTLGGSGAIAWAINRSGRIVGNSLTSAGKEHAFLYAHDSMTDLGAMGGESAYALSINDSGQIAANVNYSVNAEHAVLYKEGEVTDLGTFGGANSYANAINSAGDVVGHAGDWPFGDPRAFLYSHGRMQDLGTFGGSSSEAMGVNDLQQVVGSADTRDRQLANHAFLWEKGKMMDLNKLIPVGANFTLLFAVSINNRGQIAATGLVPGHHFHGFLLTPVKGKPGAVPPTKIQGPPGDVGATG